VRHWNVAEPAVSVMLQDAMCDGVLRSQRVSIGSDDFMLGFSDVRSAEHKRWTWLVPGGRCFEFPFPRARVLSQEREKLKVQRQERVWI